MGLRTLLDRVSREATPGATDSCITQLKAQGPSRTCNEIQEEVLLLADRTATHLTI